MPRPLTWQDVFDLQAEREVADKLKRWERLVFEDIRFFAARLSGSFTGNDGMNRLPSHIAVMEQNLEAEQSKK